ncbi:MAG: 6-phosphofructokinase [Bdellovibrionales bacterium GWA2_49_15]|nr:MAG: 6-phosphofructokinase [Bdellovibrionales bacterium GWA2_49_15]
MKSVGILCSGGDSPGMNCAIRAIVRTAIGLGLNAFGIQRGYQGLIDNQIRPLDVSSVGNIIQRGGTILQTSRSKDFMTAEGRAKAAANLREHNIDSLIVIGGNGSFKGAMKFYEEHGIPIAGIPGTIDNDISGTEYTIGFDTAVQVAIEAVDRIRDTASSHDRTFLVEVMGRNSPAIAVHVAVCTGAENIVFSKQEIQYEKIAEHIKRGMARGKNSSIIIVTEGDKPGLAYQVQTTLQQAFKIDAHVCILGHIQRGGAPSHMDRFIASRMGYLAVKSLLDGNFPLVTVYRDGHVTTAPFIECVQDKLGFDKTELELVRLLSI